jgi:hypothetical protein
MAAFNCTTGSYKPDAIEHSRRPHPVHADVCAVVVAVLGAGMGKNPIGTRNLANPGRYFSFGPAHLGIRGGAVGEKRVGILNSSLGNGSSAGLLVPRPHV